MCGGPEYSLPRPVSIAHGRVARNMCRMKIAVPDGLSVTVQTDMGDFVIEPVFTTSSTVLLNKLPTSWTIYGNALAGVSGTPPRTLSLSFPTEQEARLAFRTGFDVPDPEKDPVQTISKIVAAMLKDRRVIRV